MLPGEEWAATKALDPRFSRGMIGKGREKLSGSLTIPAAIWGEPVTGIADEAFRENQLTSVTIGANVNGPHKKRSGFFGFLKSFSIDHFESFNAFYDKNGRKAGTYTLNGKKWRFTPR